MQRKVASADRSSRATPGRGWGSVPPSSEWEDMAAQSGRSPLPRLLLDGRLLSHCPSPRVLSRTRTVTGQPCEPASGPAGGSPMSLDILTQLSHSFSLLTRPGRTAAPTRTRRQLVLLSSFSCCLYRRSEQHLTRPHAGAPHQAPPGLRCLPPVRTAGWLSLQSASGTQPPLTTSSAVTVTSAIVFSRILW